MTYLTVAEACQQTHVNERTLRRWVKNGLLKARDRGRLLRVDADGLRVLLRDYRPHKRIVRCFCGQVAITEVQIGIRIASDWRDDGFGDLIPMTLPLCADCLALERQQEKELLG